MADIKSKKVDFVNIVDAEGKPIPGFSSPVPESWIGTDLLPYGAKKDDGEPESDGDDALSQDAIDDAVKAATSELEAKVADLTKELEERKVGSEKAEAGAQAEIERLTKELAAAKKASTTK